MSNQSRVTHSMCHLLAMEIEGFDSLAELALDLRSSWNHATDHVWRQLDPVLWELTHNPWVVLQTVSRNQIERALDDPAFRKRVDDLVQTRRDAAKAPAWFQHTYPDSLLTCVAYFSMEFMLSEALPIYSGSLGIEAPATPDQKELLGKLSAQQVTVSELAGETIQTVLTHASGNGAPIGGLKVVAESGWFAARPSGTEDIYKIYAESFRGDDHPHRILEEAQAIVNNVLTTGTPHAHTSY
jgi:hypothetical protein